MTFTRAIAAGREQLGPGARAFAFAIDVAMLQDVLHFAEIVLRCPALLCVLCGAERKTGDLDRNQKIEIDPLVAAAHVECILPLEHRREARGGIVGVFQRDYSLHPVRGGRRIAAQDILSQSSFQKSNSAANRDREALGLCVLPFSKALIGLPCRALDVSVPGLCGYAGEYGINEIAKIAAAGALFHVLNGGLYDSAHLQHCLIKVCLLYTSPSPRD